MSIRAGSIINVGGRNVVDRLQTVGLDDPNIPFEAIREVGNDLVVDKVPTEADFTFRMESYDVSTDLMAFLHGAVGTQAANDPPGAADPAGTVYRWEDCQFVHITSPWKRDTGVQGGHIAAGLIIPNYYVTQLTYRFGVTDWATQEAQLVGGSFYYAQAAPVEEIAVAPDPTGVGAADYVTSEAARAYRIGGELGTTFKRVLGVLVNGVPQIEGYDYDQSVPGGTAAGASAVTTITFRPGRLPAIGARVRFVYFTEVAKTYPQAVHADTIIKPAAVRGRHIDVVIGTQADGDEIKLPGVQTVELTATVNSDTEREMGSEDPTGRSINSFDTNGTVTFRPRDIPLLFDTLKRVTGVDTDTEVIGYLNQHPEHLRVKIRNPKNPAQVLKTLDVGDSIFKIPGNTTRVNTTLDFALRFESQQGTFSEVKGDLVV